MAQATWLLLLAAIATPPAAAQTVESEEADIAVIWNRDGANDPEARVQAIGRILERRKQLAEAPLNQELDEALRSVLDSHKEKGEHLRSAEDAQTAANSPAPLEGVNRSVKRRHKAYNQALELKQEAVSRKNSDYRAQRRLRGAAALALILIGSDDPDTYALLAHSLDVVARTPGGGDTHLNSVISGLGLLGSPFPLAQRALVRALDNGDGEMSAIRKVAARSLGLIGAAHPSAVAALARCLMGRPDADPPAPPEGDPELRLECAAALGRIKPVSPLSAAALDAGTRDEDDKVRQQALASLQGRELDAASRFETDVDWKTGVPAR